VPLRGNVGTRLRKLAEGQVDATLLAVAGLKRLGQGEILHAPLEPEVMLPAAAQGAIGLEMRRGDSRTLDYLAPIDHGPSRRRILAERACLEVLDGSCRTPIAVLAELDGAGETLRLRALVALPDGSRVHNAELSGPAGDGEAIGQEAGRRLRAEAGAEFFAALADP
jgi:hydroxymethylbilane synthase